MAAVISIRRWSGPASHPTKTDITGVNTRANTEDSHSSSGTANCLLIPAIGKNFSYWVSTRLYIESISKGTIDNIRWFTDGTNNFGTAVACVGNTADSYTPASGIPGQTGLELSLSNCPTLTSEPVDIFSFTPSSPKNLTGSAAKTGDVGQFLVYQIQVGSAAQTGATAQETFTFKYDDTSV